jgi:Protein of unknown function (DUF3738)
VRRVTGPSIDTSTDRSPGFRIRHETVPLHDKRCRDVQLGNFTQRLETDNICDQGAGSRSVGARAPQIARTDSLVFQNGACGHIIPIALYANSIARLVNDPATLGLAAPRRVRHGDASVTLPEEVLKLLLDTGGNPLIGAMQQLGLKLDARKTSVDVLVVDDARTPRR